MTDDVAAAYAAGVIDSDGSIYVSKSNGHHQLGVKIGMLKSEAVDYIQANFGGNVHTSFHKASRKTQFVWVLSGKGAQTFLNRIKSYLTVKQAQAELALHYPVGVRSQFVSEEVFDQRDSIHYLMGRLNNGKVPAEMQA
ncbi:hypothetical protein LCGC14_1340920 [marine sediment metagenome]|uniref:Homing endonuclease LAGLIDADG domain-containing protein n=1 Tax=marine sediment metagenome TaxID=412755 RepID=A0A0F9L063_9ZZZZ